MRPPKSSHRTALALAVVAAAAAAGEASPAAPVGPGAPEVLAARTLVAALEVDRDGARLVAFTVKPRPFHRRAAGPARPYAAGASVQLEVALTGVAAPVMLRQEAGPLCLDHDPYDPPHVRGDRILLHRDTVLVELPELAGMDQVQTAYYRLEGALPVRVPLGKASLGPEWYSPAGGTVGFADLAFARETPGATEGLEAGGTVHWPEEYGDTERYLIYGDPAETLQRINVVIVPDGYTYAEKAALEADAAAMVAHFRNKPPYREHDPFINYVLVYGYSTESGTDQCDCDLVRNTAFGTGFPDYGYPCEHSENRCLYYGWPCDPQSTTNLVAAELRAPARDATIVMVNTPRYGGCGGSRAVYAAGAPSATEIAVHELGHSLGNLADEYDGNPSCGVSASEINTSTDGADGAWPEWVPFIGAPREGADYYNYCLYRPETNCEMRSLNQSFCRVCKQQWARVIYGHFRVRPTAPVAGSAPPSPASAYTYDPVAFSVTTRLGIGTVDTITWSLQGPGYPAPTVVATGTDLYTEPFTQPGTYTLTCEVIADTNFIRPEKYADNVDVVTWTVEVADSAVDHDGDGLSPVEGDCDDGNPAVYPGATEVCDGVNNDCLDPLWPGVTADETDADGDTFIPCAGDCDDGDPAVSPAASEVGCDGIDNDCDGGTPDVFDLDGDAFACDVDCDDSLAAVHPGAAQACDGINNDCLDPSWPSVPPAELDGDGDTYSPCAGDCDDGDPAVSPAASEVGCDGIDNDCDPFTDDAVDTDGDSYSCDTDCDNTDPATHPGALETNDGKDNQCGDAEEGFGLVDEISGRLLFPDGGDPSRLCWPAQAGATRYVILRSGDAAMAAPCEGIVTEETCWVDPAMPAPGEVLHYVARARRPHGGSTGASGAGTERGQICAAETVCSGGVDDDGDGLADCADPDCMAVGSCASATFRFTNTVGDDVPETALMEFFGPAVLEAGDHIRVGHTGPLFLPLEWCGERADFYRDTYLLYGASEGMQDSGTWTRWYREAGQNWSAPANDPVPSFFGSTCLGPFSWCPEVGLGTNGVAILPGDVGDCETFDYLYGCAPDNTVEVILGIDRASACGF